MCEEVRFGVTWVGPGGWASVWEREWVQVGVVLAKGRGWGPVESAPAFATSDPMKRRGSREDPSNTSW